MAGLGLKEHMMKLHRIVRVAIASLLACLLALFSSPTVRADHSDGDSDTNAGIDGDVDGDGDVDIDDQAEAHEDERWDENESDEPTSLALVNRRSERTCSTASAWTARASASRSSTAGWSVWRD